MSQDPELVNYGRKVLLAEADAITAASKKLDENFSNAVMVITECNGRVVTTGLGKSGHIARKLASTLSSTGTPSFFIHPTEALHGDFGMLQNHDVVIAIAYGGETREVLAVAKYAGKRKIPVISITGSTHSSLAKHSRFVINAKVEGEADTLGLAPTSSSTVTIALGDALAVATMHSKKFSREEFAELHPGGTLGRHLSMVGNVMEPLEKVPRLAKESSFTEIISALSINQIGIAAVVDAKNSLIGVISDGDLRRELGKDVDIRKMNAAALMSRSPKTISVRSDIAEGLATMERHGITRVFVVSGTGENTLVGLVRLSDLLDASVI